MNGRRIDCARRLFPSVGFGVVSYECRLTVDRWMMRARPSRDAVETDGGRMAGRMMDGARRIIDDRPYPTRLGMKSTTPRDD